VTFVRKVPYGRESQNTPGASLLYIKEGNALFPYAHTRDIADKTPQPPEATMKSNHPALSNKRRAQA
jgi:hypothetical protein